MALIRLDKLLCDAGIGTRSEVKNYIKKGRIYVSDVSEKLKPELKLDPEQCSVYFDEKPVKIYTDFRYYVLNKPAGVITATEDDTQKTVLDLLPPNIRKGLSPVGRLDKDTEGLLILTDDGQKLHHLLSPRHHVNKTYEATVTGIVSDELITAFEEGVDIGDDKITLPAKLEIKKKSDNQTETIITIHEGRYHQIKRMFAAYGHTVTYLKRVAMGAFYLPEDLAGSEYRLMTAEEVKKLDV